MIAVGEVMLMSLIRIAFYPSLERDLIFFSINHFQCADVYRRRFWVLSIQIRVEIMHSNHSRGKWTVRFCFVEHVISFPLLPFQNLHSNFTRWENNISRLEKDTDELMNERRMGSIKMRGRRGNGGMIFDDRKDNCCLTRSPVIDLENVVELNENGSVAASASVSPLSVHSHSKGNGHQQISGYKSEVFTLCKRGNCV